MVKSDTNKEKWFLSGEQAFWHAIRIRYHIPLERLPTRCLCGDSFNLQHALSCPKRWLVIARHDELRNFATEILGNGCKNVIIEPLLTPLMGEKFPKSSNTSNQAREDVLAGELWINRHTVFCDVRVFNPLARYHLNYSPPAVHENNENGKKWKYNQYNLSSGTLMVHITCVFIFWGNEQETQLFLFAYYRTSC